MHVQRLSPVGSAWRVVVVGIGATLGTVVGGLVVAALQSAVPDVPGLDPTIALALRPLSAMLLALLLAPIALRLDVPTHERTGILFVLLWGLNILTNVIEGAFFSRWLGSRSISCRTAHPFSASARTRRMQTPRPFQAGAATGARLTGQKMRVRHFEESGSCAGSLK